MKAHHSTTAISTTLTEHEEAAWYNITHEDHERPLLLPNAGSPRQERPDHSWRLPKQLLA